MRHFVLLLISFLLVIGSLVATIGTLQLRNHELRGYVDPTNDPSLPFMAPRPGVNVDLLQHDVESQGQHLARIAASGFVWVRQFINWDEIEPSQGQFHWSQADRFVAELRGFPDIEPVFVITNTPKWARVTHPSVEVTVTGPPASLADFAEFVGAFAGRYGDVIDYYQIWDEPNLDDAWGLLHPRPAEYVAILDVAQRAIRAADPSSTIIAAALAPTTETGGQNISDFRYLDAMYQLGAADMMDIVAAKPYGFDSSPLDRVVDESVLNFSRVVGLREIMLKHDDAQTPIWASHWGWNSLPDDWSGDPSIWGSVTADEQILYTVQAFDRAHRELPWLGAMILHQWQPSASGDSAQWGFSLLRQDGSPSALLHAIQSYDFPERAENGLFHARSKFARYSGVWQFSELGADIGWLETSDSRLEFDFYGSDLAMLLREDNYVAFLYPTVDGEQANATANDSDGNSYIFLRSNSHGPELNLAPVVKNLNLTSHILSAVADRGWDHWSIVGYAVSSGNLSSLYDRQIALGVVATLLSLPVFLMAVAVSPWRRWIPAVSFVLAGISASAHLALSGVTSVVMMFGLLFTWTSQRPTIIVRDEVNILLALATGGVLYLSPGALLSIVAALILFVLIYQRLENGLALTIFWAPFFLSPVQLYQYGIPMVEVMLLITTAAAVLRCLVWLGIQYQMENSAYPWTATWRIKEIKAIDLGLAALGIIAVFSLSWTRYDSFAITELRTLILEPLLFYALLRAVRPSKSVLLRWAAALVIAGLVVSVIGLLRYFTSDAVILAEGGARRLIAVYGSPNNVGLLLGRTIPLALAFALAALGMRFRLAAAMAVIVMGITALLTQSLGAILLGLPAGVTIVLLGRYRLKAFMPLLGLSVVGALGFALLTRVTARFANILDISQGTTFIRLRLWESAIEIIRDHPIRGLGLDQFLYVYSGEYVRPDAIWDLDLSHPHNFILDFWIRLTIAGPVIFVFVQIAYWRHAAAALGRFRDQDPICFALTLGLMGSMAALLAHGLIDNSVFVIDLAFIFAFQLAAIMRLSDLSRQNRS